MNAKYIILIIGVLFIGLVWLGKSDDSSQFLEVKHDIEDLHNNNQQMLILADSIDYKSKTKSEKITKLDSLNSLKDLTIEGQNHKLKQMLQEAEKARVDAEKARDEALESRNLAEKYKTLSHQSERISKEQQKKAEQAYSILKKENESLRKKLRELESSIIIPDTILVVPTESIQEKTLEEPIEKKKRKKN